MACEPLATQSPLRHRPGSGIVIAANFVAALAMRQLAGISMPDLLLTTNGRTETDGEDYDVTSEGRLVAHIQAHCGARGDALDVGLGPFTP
jgi:hypothetical protein